MSPWMKTLPGPTPEDLAQAIQESARRALVAVQGPFRVFQTAEGEYKTPEQVSVAAIRRAHRTLRRRDLEEKFLALGIDEDGQLDALERAAQLAVLGVDDRLFHLFLDLASRGQVDRAYLAVMADRGINTTPVFTELEDLYRRRYAPTRSTIAMWITLGVLVGAALTSVLTVLLTVFA